MSYYYKTTTVKTNRSCGKDVYKASVPRISLWEFRDLENDDLKLNWPAAGVRNRSVSYVQDGSDKLPVLRKL